LLEKEFAAYIKVPSVSVVVTAVNSFKIYVMGAGITTETAAATQGGQAGSMTLRRDTSLLQLFAQLRLQKDADLKNAYVMRGGKKLAIDFYKLVIGGDTSQDIQLKPNDLIFVPDTFQQRIRVVGAVKTPGIFPFMDGMTALDAVLSAGGFNDYASQNNVEVVRKGADKVENIRVRLKDVINDGEVSKNLLLKPGDIVKVNTGLF
jgi:polysaccharide export outer membrane protein